MVNYYSTNEVMQRTGFNKRVLNELLPYIKEVIEPYSKRGSCNKWQFDSIGMDIWDKVKQLKDNGLGNNSIMEEVVNYTEKYQNTHRKLTEK